MRFPSTVLDAACLGAISALVIAPFTAAGAKAGHSQTAASAPAAFAAKTASIR